MSRIGKLPIVLPAGVTLTVQDQTVTVSGPKGTLTQRLHPAVTVAIADGMATVSVSKPTDPKQHALWGLFQRLIASMVLGVTEGFRKQLEINGVGYKAVVQGSKLIISVGYSHPVEYVIPEGITITVEKNLITVSGNDKQRVGQVAAEIRAVRKPEPYKGKGIKYVTEVIRRKAGKAAAKGQ